MTDSEGEIEFLDEDADIVQQCVQTASQNIPLLTQKSSEPRQLLVERQPKRKKSKYDDSSDYDPSEDLKAQFKKRKTPVPSKNTVKIQTPRTIQKPNLATKIVRRDPLEKRRKLDIKVPDYEDPLCLPVKLIRRDDYDVKKLWNWNSLCLDHLKTADDTLKPKTGETVISKRMVVLRNIQHNLTGKVEMTVWSKTTAENAEGNKKSEVFQCVLPQYRERTLLDYSILPAKKKKGTRSTTTMILTKEENKDGEMLVAFSLSDAVSAVYKLVDAPEDDEETEKSSPAAKRYLQETSCCKVCAPCYQGSWRPTRYKGQNKTVTCPICSRTFTSVHNFLSHARTHSAVQVRRHRRDISSILAKVVDYHYKCRICQQESYGIKELRKHVTSHLSNEKFMCEVGNHWTQ